MLGLLLGPAPMLAQSGISGRVVDAESGEGLSYVSILYKLDPYLGTTTDQDGRFVIEVPDTGYYRLRFSMIGFQSVTLDSIRPGRAPLDIELHPEHYLTREVVVSAARRSQRLHLAPASVGLVTRQQIQQSGIRTFDEAFNNMNGVVVIRSSGTNVQSLSIRGASETAGGGSGNRVLLLLDGRPAISPESGGALWNLIPLGVVERVEVIKGAYSSLFGSSAMGGVVNLITREPDTTPVTQIHAHLGAYAPPRAYTGYTRTGTFYGVEVNHSLRQGKWAYLFNTAMLQNTGHREKSAYSLYNGYAKVRYDFSPNRHLTASGMYNDMYNDTPATWLSRLRPNSVADFRKDDYQDRREWNVDLNYQAFAHSRIMYTTRFYHYGLRAGYNFNADPANDSTNVNIGKQIVESSEIAATRTGINTQIDLSAGDDHYLIGGMEWSLDNINGQPDIFLYGRHRAWNAAAYVQDQWSIGDRWIVTGGLRYDYYQITGTFDEANISPKIAAVYQHTPNTSFRALIARAYRNPSIAERFIKFEQGGGLSFIQSPSLRSEKLTLSAEVGAKFATGDRLRWDVAVFYNKYTDLISYRQVPTPGGEFLFEVINLNRAIMQGLEIELAYPISRRLFLRAGYTWLDARDDSPNRLNDVLAYKPRHTSFANLHYTAGIFSLFGEARSRSRLDEVFIYPGSEPDGYLLFNVKADVRIREAWRVYGRVENATNREYEEVERYRMPGRTWTCGIVWSM